MSDAQPIPFEIVSQDGVRVATNGGLRMSLLEDDGRLFKRRGVSGLALKPAAEIVLPLLNGLAGELLANPLMPNEELTAKLIALTGFARSEKPVNHEWAVAQIGDVYVYTDGQDVVVTRKDLMP